MNIVFLSLFILLGTGSFLFGQEDRKFTDFINDATDGSSFDQAVALKDECDYSQCKDRACLKKVFDETVFNQELEYASDKFGKMGRDWKVIGSDEVNAYDLSLGTYYDDLGIENFATGEKKVLHFDITSPVNELERQKFHFR
ncbi:MAG: hypothetical protein FJZ09_00480 [Candidatus Omnitrophica bacterium]|nr:hypothetical protein [Candidatus Omnitrophota bacterium]